jgi:hypothetical protein
LDFAKGVDGVIESNKNSQISQPYTPSWVDRLTEWVEGLPGPSWLAYLILFFLLGIANHLVNWGSGDLPWGEIDIKLILYNLFTAEILFFFKYLDIDALRALRDFRPLLDVSDESFSKTEFEFSNQPNRPVLFWTLIGAALGCLYAYSVVLPNNEVFEFTPDTAFDFVGLAIPIILAMVFVYRMIRQLSSVSRLYASAPNIDLFNLDPLYALSSHTAKTGVIFLFLIYTNILVDPESLQLATVLITALVLSVLSSLAFILPLRGINQRLVREKKRMLNSIHQRIKATFSQIDQRFEGNEFEKMGELERTVSILEMQKEIISKIPTWPWQPATMRGFLSAILLPVGIWVIQQVLEGVLNF